MRHISLFKTIVCMLLVVNSSSTFAAGTSLCTGAIKGRTVAVAPIGFQTLNHSYKCAGGGAPPCAGFEFDHLPGMVLNPAVVDPMGGIRGIIVMYRFTFQNITSIPQTIDLGKSVVNGAWGGRAWGGAVIPGGGTMGNTTMAASGNCNKIGWSRGNLMGGGPVETGCVATLGPNEAILGGINVIVCGNGSVHFVPPGTNSLAQCDTTAARSLDAWTIFNLNVNACADRGAITGALSLSSDSIGGMYTKERFPPSVTPINGGRPF